MKEINESSSSEDEMPQLVHIKPKKLCRLFYSKLERYRTLSDIYTHHVKEKEMARREKAYYWKHMKGFRTRRCSHAGQWYSKDPVKLLNKMKKLFSEARYSKTK